jgi:hypothetical protein
MIFFLSASYMAELTGTHCAWLAGWDGIELFFDW